jgi:endonuclease-3
LAQAELTDVKTAIRSINFFNAKAKNLIAMASQLVARFGGKVPPTMADLLSLPGVGRKTANVILAQAFGKPAITVDTHVKRVTYRLGFHRFDDPTKIEFRLQRIWPPEIWDRFCIVLILHGRTVCHVRKPQCTTCLVTHLCPKKGVSERKVKED